MTKLIFLFLTLCLYSCENIKLADSAEIISKNNSAENLTQSEKIIKSQDSLSINYLEHKNLLDILKILPDSAFSSWLWKKDDRIELVSFIEKNNSTRASSKYFSKFSLTGPNTIGIQVVDGFWTLAIYKIKQNDYIVITDDQVGDGNQLMAFEYKNQDLNYLKFDRLFENSISQSVLNTNESGCKELLEDNLIGFEYDFTYSKKILISNTYLKKKANCFKGNTLEYQFNPDTKKFDLAHIKWVTEKE